VRLNRADRDLLDKASGEKLRDNRFDGTALQGVWEREEMIVPL
jgi:hypothetical protein